MSALHEHLAALRGSMARTEGDCPVPRTDTLAQRMQAEQLEQAESAVRASRQNALFIVPDAPSGNDEQVKWPALTDLRRAVTRGGNIRLPDGPTIVVGHSGAFRTVMKWVDHKVVAQVILLDALYGGQRAFDDFISSGKRAGHHKLIVVGSDTAEESVSFTRRYPFAVTRDRMPGSAADFSKREKRARLLYIRSQYGHMQIVDGGRVLPTLLRLTPLAALR